MAKTPDTDNTAHHDSPTHSGGPENSGGPATPLATAPNRAASSPTRWVLSSLAAVGLLGLGLLGGMQIGQHMVRTGPDASRPLIIQEDGPSHYERLPDGMRERMMERWKDRVQERRDDHPAPSSPGDSDG